MLKKTVFLFCILLTIVLTSVAVPRVQAAEGQYMIASENALLFKDLFASLLEACETPSQDDLPHLQEIQQQIARRNEKDGILAEAITSHWLSVFVGTDGSYTDHLFLWDKATEAPVATELLSTPLADCPSHAFIVLGYQLENGEMTEELKGRCEAAAAAARAFPEAILVCTGGATGSNNPERHTEAGRMKEYLNQVCGIDASRIFTDDLAMTTIDNAIHALAIVRSQNIHSITVITSDYHQKWGQVLCNAEAAMEYLQHGYSIQLIENYSYQTDPLHPRSGSPRTAISQLSSLLRLNSYPSLPDEIP